MLKSAAPRQTGGLGFLSNARSPLAIQVTPSQAGRTVAITAD